MVGLEHTVQKYDAGSQVVSYSIPLEDFQGPAPTEPQLYSPYQKINRMTFMSMWINSFNFSRNDLNAQKFFLDWLEANNGLDYRTTLGNFNAADGSNCLSSQEQAMFISAYRNIRTHFEYNEALGQPQFPDTVVISGLDYWALLFSNPELEKYQKRNLNNPIYADEPLEGMSKRKLTQIIDRHIKENKRIQRLKK